MDEPADLVEGQFCRIECWDSVTEFYFDWDLGLLKAEIPELCRELSLLFSTGRSSAS